MLHPTGSIRLVHRRPARRGFTLIEMLISVTLVLMMMVLFAEIFTLASNSMTLQRAIADNDQQVRSFSSILRSDLQKRTYRLVTPYSPLESIDFQTLPFEDRSGYIYISLNDPDNAVDNLLQFTVRSTVTLENGDESPYYGKATGLVFPLIPGEFSSQSQAERHVRSNYRQPEHDDGDLEMNETGASTAAEVCYFVRGGRLYRRVVLLRDPLNVSGSGDPEARATWSVTANASIPQDPEYFRHPNTVNGSYRVYKPTGTGATQLSDDFWADFDYASYAQFGSSLIGAGALGNGDQSAGAVTLGRIFGLQPGGSPTPRCYRFGFDQYTGISREFSHADPSQPGFFFIGRYTLEEMSHPAFDYPQRGQPVSAGSVVPNPMSYADTPALVDAAGEPDGVVDALANGPRRGQDILLSNVHSFEIEVWDDRIGDFVLPGHSRTNASGEPGDYHRSRNLQLANGITIVPGSPAAWNTAPYDRWVGRSFDTWHFANDVDNNVATTADRQPPYRALAVYPNAPVPSTVTGALPVSLSGVQTFRGRWTPATNYNVNDIIFADHNRPSDFSHIFVCIGAGTSGGAHEDLDGDGFLDTEDMNMNGTLDPGEDTNGNGALDTEDVNGNGILDESEPNWIIGNNSIFEPNLPGEPRWVSVRNVRPMRAIRIRVRFLHVSSGEMRQLTLVHPLVD